MLYYVEPNSKNINENSMKYICASYKNTTREMQNLDIKGYSLEMMRSFPYLNDEFNNENNVYQK